MRLLFKLLTLVVLGSFGMIALSSVAERFVLYPFDPSHVEPADAGLSGVTEHRFHNDDETLIAWTADPAPGKPVILYFHGNAGNLAVRAGRLRRFLDRGYGLFAPAYRGSSGSTGTPSEAALTWDAETAYHALFTRFSDLPAGRVILYGESLGTAVAIALMATPSTNSHKGFGPPAAILLEAPFTSISDLAEHHYPGTGDFAAKLENKWPSLTRAEALGPPLLVLHGTKDDLIPIEMGRQIFAAAPSRRKDFLTVKGAGHTDLWRSDTLPRLWRFIDQFALR